MHDKRHDILLSPKYGCISMPVFCMGTKNIKLVLFGNRLEYHIY